MKPIDYRNAAFADLDKRLTGLRQRVFKGWLRHGPCTTEDLAHKTGISILTLRPRTTELFQLGFVVIDKSSSSPGGQGAIYRGATHEEVRAHFARMKSATTAEAQLNLL